MNDLQQGPLTCGETTGTGALAPPDGGNHRQCTDGALTNDVAPPVTDRLAHGCKTRLNQGAGTETPNAGEVYAAAVRDDSKPRDGLMEPESNGDSLPNDVALMETDRVGRNSYGQRKRVRETREGCAPQESAIPPRSLRQRPQRPSEPSIGDSVEPSIYILGQVPGCDREEWLRMLACFHRDGRVRSLVAEATGNAENYLLKVQKKGLGWGYAATKDIPAGQLLGYYSGVLVRARQKHTSQYVMELGRNVGGFPYRIDIDGDPALNAPGALERPGQLQLVNHSCSPNCAVTLEDTESGVGMMLLRSRFVIPMGSDITIAYGGSHWEKAQPPLRVRRGYRRTFCLCSVPHLCPNRLWRDDPVQVGLRPRIQGIELPAVQHAAVLEPKTAVVATNAQVFAPMGQNLSHTVESQLHMEALDRATIAAAEETARELLREDKLMDDLRLELRAACGEAIAFEPLRSDYADGADAVAKGAFDPEENLLIGSQERDWAEEATRRLAEENDQLSGSLDALRAAVATLVGQDDRPTPHSLQAMGADEKSALQGMAALPPRLGQSMAEVGKTSSKSSTADTITSSNVSLLREVDRRVRAGSGRVPPRPALTKADSLAADAVDSKVQTDAEDVVPSDFSRKRVSEFLSDLQRRVDKYQRLIDRIHELETCNPNFSLYSPNPFPDEFMCAMQRIEDLTVSLRKCNRAGQGIALHLPNPEELVCRIDMLLHNFEQRLSRFLHDLYGFRDIIPAAVFREASDLYGAVWAAVPAPRILAVQSRFRLLQGFYDVQEGLPDIPYVACVMPHAEPSGVCTNTSVLVRTQATLDNELLFYLHNTRVGRPPCNAEGLLRSFYEGIRVLAKGCAQVAGIVKSMAPQCLLATVGSKKQIAILPAVDPPAQQTSPTRSKSSAAGPAQPRADRGTDSWRTPVLDDRLHGGGGSKLSAGCGAGAATGKLGGTRGVVNTTRSQAGAALEDHKPGASIRQSGSTPSTVPAGQERLSCDQPGTTTDHVGGTTHRNRTTTMKNQKLQVRGGANLAKPQSEQRTLADFLDLGRLQSKDGTRCTLVPTPLSTGQRAAPDAPANRTIVCGHDSPTQSNCLSARGEPTSGEDGLRVTARSTWRQATPPPGSAMSASPCGSVGDSVGNGARAVQPPLDAAKKMSWQDGVIPAERRLPGLTPWVPGTSALYVPPTRGLPPEAQQTFPVWNVKQAGVGWQQAMFTAADRISLSAFYVAADVWTKKGTTDWALGKIFGAFSSASDFVAQLLTNAPTRCFYEVIREGRACKAYFDLEADPGVMSAQQGHDMCQQVIQAWEVQIRSRWPQAVGMCPRCVEALVLDGSRSTSKGWKVSYHVVYPWLTFPGNTTTLKEAATALSDLPQLQYRALNGTIRRFIDPAVYSRNRQFRLPMSWKLSDETCTALRLPGTPLLSNFLLACITQLETDAWVVPHDDSPAGASGRAPAVRTAGSRHAAIDTAAGVVDGAAAFVLKALQEAGQPNGQLTPVRECAGATTFRWITANDRPCAVAQIWRPENPRHNSNGALVTVDATRAIFLKCLHPDCQRLSPGRGLFLGYLPPLDTNGAKALACASNQRSCKRVLSGGSVCPEGPARRKPGLHNEKSHFDQEGGGGSGGSGRSEAGGNRCLPTSGRTNSGNAPDLGMARPASDSNVVNSQPIDPPQQLPVLPRNPELSSSQSFQRVFSSNQSADNEPFAQWTVEVGPRGGKLGALTDSSGPQDSNSGLANGGGAAPDLHATVQEWLENPPFVRPPPEQMLTAVHAALEMDNKAYSAETRATLQGWAVVSAMGCKTAEDTTAVQAIDKDPPDWEILPPSAWFQHPLGRREPIGWELVRAARDQLDRGEWRTAPHRPVEETKPNLWESPFTVGSLNVGFRGLRCSLQGLIGFVEKHRPDVLLLADLRTARHKVGRLRKELELELGEEWFLLTEISAAAGRPVGVGALIHSSLARHATKLEVVRPPGIASESWSEAVQGRILLLQLSRPELSCTWWFVGVYQHIASETNDPARHLLMLTLGHLKVLAAEGGHRLVIMGDANAAPQGGRWGYSPSSKVWAADQRMAEWVLGSGLREVCSEPLRATWRACLHPRKAVLDRAWVYPASLCVSPLSVNWAVEQTVFDHALILVNLPQAMAGVGYAGACRPLRVTQPIPRCRVNLRQWREKYVEEWTRLLKLSLAAADSEECAEPPDPFQALKHGELVADSIAQSLAPRRIRRPGETRRAFGFEGHRCLHRELNLLQAARTLVHKVLQGPGGVLHSPHRTMIWQTTVTRLNHHLRRSCHVLPPELFRPASWYFSAAAKPQLKEWLGQAKEAADVRWAEIRERHAKARYSNIQQLRTRLVQRGGVLDTFAVQAALGKRQPRQRMWGVSGPVALGVGIWTSGAENQAVLEFLSKLSSTGDVQRLIGRPSEIQLWFRGPRPLGDFLLQWCTISHRWRHLRLRTLNPPGQYLAILPDDMLAVQELHLATEGMDSESICPQCRMPGVRPIVTGAQKQLHGNPGRAVRFLCVKCGSVHDDVMVADLPPCPVPLEVWQALRKIPSDSPPLICRPVDFSTLEECVRRLPNDKSPGTDGIPYEYYKHGPPELLELLRAAINAYLRGDTPSVDSSDWSGGLVTLADKIAAAVKMGDRRPLSNLCTKYKVTTSIVNKRATKVFEDHNILDEAQEGFRRHRSTKRQLSKLHSIFQEGRRRKCLSVVLYLDLKNAFNAINHRVIFMTLDAYGFPKADVDMFRRMYSGTWYSVGNPFGETAACYLRRGVKQGDIPSPQLFDATINPLHKMIRASGRGSSLPALLHPTGASGFADDTCIHIDGPDAIAAMRTVVVMAGQFLRWAGPEVNVAKSKISAIDYATGRQIATDSITLDGSPFTAIAPSSAQKHLGVRTTMTGDFSAEKAYVREEMQRRLEALRQDEVLSPSFKEVVLKIGIVSVFRYSAGLVPWTRTELDNITSMWARGCKQAWGLPVSSDGSLMLLSYADGGRECPSAIEVWIRDALDLLDQCLSLPGEISQIARYHLQRSCQDRGCASLDQLQRILRIGGRAQTVVELLLQRLDEQGLEVSSPWTPCDKPLVSAALWPRLWRVWEAKENWAGCTELDEVLQGEWHQALECLQAIRRLGQVGILTVPQLVNSSRRWVGRPELISTGCKITELEYNTLVQWLGSVDVGGLLQECSGSLRDPQANDAPHTLSAPYHCGQETWRALSSIERAHRSPLPPCIVGQVRSMASHDCMELEQVVSAHEQTELGVVPDSQLADALCRSRSVFSFTLDGQSQLTVECLVPLRRVWQHQAGSEFIVVQNFCAPITTCRLAAFSIAFVRDCLLANGLDTLREACTRPPWRVAREVLRTWFDLRDPTLPSQQWRLEVGGADGQQVLRNIVLDVRRRRGGVEWRAPVMLQPWQSEPPLPDRVQVDLSNHSPLSLPSPEGWEIWQRNARVLITDPLNRTVGLSSAQYGMLKDLLHPTDPFSAAPTAPFLVAIRASCLSQRRADSTHHVHWNRHFLACLRTITQADLLLGARAVTFHPHFRHFHSPCAGDTALGAVDMMQWPAVPALLILDSFEPSSRREILRRASLHVRATWVLRQEKPSPAAAADKQALGDLRARLCAQLPVKSMVLHGAECWSESSWDPTSARHMTQVWLLSNGDLDGSELQQPLVLQQALGSWAEPRFDFHWREDPIPRALQSYRARQQDAVQYSWQGLIAGTDGSVHYQQERMGAGYVVGIDPIPLLELSVRVGGPLSSLRAEAASLYVLVSKVQPDVNLLVFVDCLGLLLILLGWGQADFWPEPGDLVHFDVILPLIELLRSRVGLTLLFKVKSHSGCLQNERADLRAGRGIALEEEGVCPGPSKYGSLHLRIKPSFRERTRVHLPRDNAPNRAILARVVKCNTLSAVKLRNTIFVRDLLLRRQGAAIAGAISKCRDSVIRCWMKAMSGLYPTATYLHRIRKVESNKCPYCTLEVPETLTHFMCVCPKFREARTAAHNRAWTQISNFFVNNLVDHWQFYIETPMGCTGLRLQPVQLGSDPLEQTRVQRWQPDATAISYSRKKIAIVDLCRPSDVCPEQLRIASDRKVKGYDPLKTALQLYSDAGWQIEILPWVVGIRGLIQESELHNALKFLEIPKTAWPTAIERTVVASVESLAFMNRVRYSSINQNRVFDSNDPNLGCVGEMSSLQRRKRQRPTSGASGLEETRLKWRRMALNPCQRA